jgi:hypothetical protein
MPHQYRHGAIGEWCTSVVTDMNSLFSVLMNAGAASFNEPLAKWNMRKVTTMNGMFYGASAFNQPLATWNACLWCICFQPALGYMERGESD